MCSRKRAVFLDVSSRTARRHAEPDEITCCRPNEMGELFKVIALGKGIAEPFIGFARGDQTRTL